MFEPSTHCELRLPLVAMNLSLVRSQDKKSTMLRLMYVELYLHIPHSLSQWCIG